MDNGFRKISSSDLDEHIKPILEQLLLAQVLNRDYGHCMRVGDLSTKLMVEVAASMTATIGEQAQVHVLVASEADRSNPLMITSSKLVELRNPLKDGSLRPPLLVFVPNDLRTAAEDSFAEATFEQIQVSNAYSKLHQSLLEGIPSDMRTYVEECMRFLRERSWKWADEMAEVRFLLSIKLNGYDQEVVGAALCELGLIPDFALLETPSLLANRLVKNLDAAKTLAFSPKSEIGRVLDLKLDAEEVQSGLIEFFTKNSLEDPIAWTAKIVCEPTNRRLSFEKWGSGDPSAFAQKIQVQVLSVGVPLISEDELDPKLRDLKGERVLVIGGNGPNSFSVKFHCTPAPESIPDLDHFRLAVVSREEGPTGTAKKKKSWPGPRLEATQSFTKVRSMDWEDGWHFIRVLPCSEDGDILPMVDAEGRPVPIFGEEGEKEPPHESDYFYVLRDAEVEVEVPQRAVPRFPTLQHAQISHWFKVVLDGGKAEEVTATRVNGLDTEGGATKQELVEFKFAGEGSINVPISRPLRLMETKILRSGGQALSWTMTLNHRDDPVCVPLVVQWPKLAGMDEFLVLRERLFFSISGEDGKGLVELVCLGPLEELILEYAQQYLELLSRGLKLAESCVSDRQADAVASIRCLLALDSTSVSLTDYRGGQRNALLVSPIHPLRLLWLVTWRSLALHWLKLLGDNRQEYASATREALFDRLSLVNFPASMATESGRIVQAVDNIHPLWTVYATTDESDPRGLVAELCTALELPEPTIGSFTLNGTFIASRIRRYLAQHPYVETLTLNCFNGGRGKILADALLELQAIQEFRDLRYDLRLFVGNPEAPGVGEDLAELISPSSSITSPEADVFASPTGIHLSPKLTFAVRSEEDFHRNTIGFPANITLLFDVFPARTLSAMEPLQKEEVAPVHGLLQDYSIIYEEENERVAWHRCPRHGSALAIPGREDLAQLISTLASTCSSAAASIATGQAGMNMRPVSILVLEPDQKALLHKVHEVSDWVFTIDKSMGIEFFDHSRKSQRPEYLIDHSPDLTSNSGRRVVISSRSQTEIRVLFERVLSEHKMSRYSSRSHALLSELRVLSGRFALKLASACTHRAEALGLALAKLFLEYQGAFKDQAVVPLDSHLDLFRTSHSTFNEISDEVSLKRTDLGLFEFDATSMVLTCRLVEVKCYKNAGGSITGLHSLRASIAEQLLQSEQVLRRHFDPGVDTERDRPDRVLKTQELIAMLEFYVERANRLGFLAHDAYDEAKFFLRSMENGFHMRFTRSALIFDFEKPGREETHEDNGIEYHRIGYDLIESLIESLPVTSKDSETVVFEAQIPELPPTEDVDTETVNRLAAKAFPRLPSASFLPPPRAHTVHWDNRRNSTSFHTNESDKSRYQSKDGILEDSDTDTGEEVNTDHQVQDSVGIAKIQMEEPVISQEEKLTANEQVKTVDSVLLPIVPEMTENDGAISKVECDILLGCTGDSPQFGVLGKVHGRTVGLDLNQTQTISLFGVQGGGKSYTLGSIIELATMAIPKINELPKPLATVVFHYSQTQDYKPEFTSMNRPNDDASAIESLLRDYGAQAAALGDVVLLSPEAKVSARKMEYPGIEVHPLKFASSELQAAHWRFLMGAIGNQATYIRRLNQLMRGMRDNLSLSGLRNAVQSAGFTDSLRDLALMRLDLAASYIDDSSKLSDLIRPGRLVIVDLRDEFIDKDEALGLFVVLLQLFADATYEGDFFNKLVVFDEAHKYVENPDLVDGLISVVREMRHKGTSVLVASQDPPSVPVALIELSTQIILHRLNSPAWLKHIQKANAALLGLQSEQLARLKPGEAYVWSAKSNDRTFSNEAVKIQCRPRITLHGGDTKTAVR